MDLIAEYNKGNAFGQSNHYDLTVHSPGHITYKMIIGDEHFALKNVVHGGVIAGFMDAILSVAGFSAVAEAGMYVATVEFKINYLRPATKKGKLTGIGKVLKNGKRLIVTTGKIFDDEKQLLATAIGTLAPYKPT